MQGIREVEDRMKEKFFFGRTLVSGKKSYERMDINSLDEFSSKVY